MEVQKFKRFIKQSTFIFKRFVTFGLLTIIYNILESKPSLPGVECRFDN